MDDPKRKNGKELTPQNPRGAGRPPARAVHQRPQDLSKAVALAKAGKRSEALSAAVDAYLDKPHGTKLTDDVIAAILARIACGDTLASACASYDVNPGALLMRRNYDPELRGRMRECRQIAGDIAFDQVRDLLTASHIPLGDRKFAFNVLKYLAENLNRAEYAANLQAPPVAIQINFTDREDRML